MHCLSYRCVCHMAASDLFPFLFRLSRLCDQILIYSSLYMHMGWGFFFFLKDRTFVDKSQIDTYTLHDVIFFLNFDST